MDEHLQKKQKGSGGSALTRLKQQFKKAGLTGYGNAASKISKKASKQKRDKLLDARKQARENLRNQFNSHVNPFELKTTKLKHAVFNDKVKGVVGRPGVTHKKGELARKKTLLVEMKKMKKESAFTDRRFGENDPNVSMEDKVLQRFVKEKTKRTDKRSIFNLEEETLTHLGQSLDVATEYVPPMEDDDDNAMSSDFVSRMNFGGSTNSNNDSGYRSRTEIMNEVIAKSKMYKAERQKAAEETAEIAKEADLEYATIKSLLADQKKLSRESGNTALAFEEDPFDIAVREMATDRKARPTDRTLTEDEILLKEKNRLEKLEQDRIKRMRGMVDNGEEEKKRLPQGDDLDDLIIDMDEEDEEMPLTYKDGVLINKNVFLSSNIRNARKADEDGEEDDDDEDDDDDDDDDDDESVDSNEDVEFQDGYGDKDDISDADEEKSKKQKILYNSNQISESDEVKSDLPFVPTAP
ncbi:nucleolar complex protein 14, partial [Nowakowskiella sp. JEL0078]